MPLPIPSIRKLFSKHPDMFALSTILFFIGIAIGLLTQRGEEIVEQAQAISIDPFAFFNNIIVIFVNNASISTIAWVGWFLSPILGIGYLPPTIMIYNVGAAFGAVFGYAPPLNSVLTLAAFGLLEAFGLILGMTAGLLFPKYLFLKITRRTVSLEETFQHSFVLFVYSVGFLLVGAVLESILLHPNMSILAVPIGAVVTACLFYLVAKYA